MLLVGKSITTPGDPLQETTVEKIYKAIINPAGDVAALQQKLRQIKMMDINQYRKMKTALPYIVCARFHPRVRRKENFLDTERFLIDIDHLSEFELDIHQVKKELKKDPRVELLFTSPGGDGLKVLMVLQDKITDSGYYALFYKTFCHRFATQHILGAAVDDKTNDVSRCCFVSFDENAYYNPGAEKVNAAGYLSPEGFEDFERVNKEVKKEEKERAVAVKETGVAIDHSVQALTDDVLRKIKEKVGMKVKTPKEKYYEQPEELDAIMQEIADQLATIQVTIEKTKPISYGRQLKLTAGRYWAEVNIFYGQKGVSIVGSTKNGSNSELRDSVVLLLKNHFS